jgi:hypothetical protein
MRCDASPVPANGGDLSRAASELICAGAKSCWYHDTTLYTANGLYDYPNPCMDSLHYLCGVINKPSFDGALRILYQSHLCNNIMQGSGHILSHCDNYDEYQYRYNYDAVVKVHVTMQQ